MRLALWLTLSLSILGCNEANRARQPATSTARPTDGRYRSVEIAGVKHVRQKPDFCGEAVAASYLNKLGKDYTQDDVFALSGIDPARGMGATTREMKTALERIGFATGAVWYTVAANEADAQLERLFADMHDDLLRGVPSIVCTHYDDSPGSSEHFRLVLGYDASSDEVIYHEPAEDDGAYKRMDRSHFKQLWPLKYDVTKWTAIRLRLDPQQPLREPPARASFGPAKYAQHVRKLRDELPTGFTVVIEPPFVVIGDESPQMVRKRAATTVRWAVSKLKAAYFAKDPNHIIDVWLFKDADSYQRHAEQLWAETPSTPYGYYSRTHRAMVMNIATGGGTLVHEIVHPFIEANFPAAPDWLNEGLGSLYEQSAERDGAIVGLTNWRLAGLQRAIADNRVPSFRQLTATTTHQFYEQDPGTNYAQSRYLMYYLQEHGMLRRYFRAAVRNQDADPTGYETLKNVLGRDDMSAFEKHWQRWVSQLRFP